MRNAVAVIGKTRAPVVIAQRTFSIRPPMNLSQPFSAVLLVGGQSRRMGVNKATVVVDGEPLWQRQLSKLRASGADEVFISGRSGAPYGEAGVQVIEDITPDAGPLAGFQAALRHARNRWLLVLAIDLPDVDVAFLRTLVAEAIARDTALVPAHDEWLQPTAAVYTRECLPLVEECLAGENRSLRRFFRRAHKAQLAQIRPVSESEQAQFRNLNTPDDLAARSQREG